ncbi:hypothetical protein P5G52_12010 [Arthrobacter sp. IIF3SC--B10]|uniref:Uncharacterized protein n=1 Tax=Arthrobacter burdickii TaxID=3035920 RepID=A0ABT8K2E9_9MICC|nr:hypothetical protein [Arthrobacter burdickii]MDN4611586.1 hypothetical protein [Arthrobacter burdickii]
MTGVPSQDVVPEITDIASSASCTPSGLRPPLGLLSTRP